MSEKRGRPPRLPAEVERDLLDYLRGADARKGRAPRRRDLSMLAVIWNLAAAQKVAQKVAAGASQREAVAALAAEVLPCEANTAKEEDALRDAVRRWGARLNRSAV